MYLHCHLLSNLLAVIVDRYEPIESLPQEYQPAVRPHPLVPMERGGDPPKAHGKSESLSCGAGRQVPRATNILSHCLLQRGSCGGGDALVSWGWLERTETRLACPTAPPAQAPRRTASALSASSLEAERERERRASHVRAGVARDLPLSPSRCCC